MDPGSLSEKTERQPAVPELPLVEVQDVHRRPQT